MLPISTASAVKAVAIFQSNNMKKCTYLVYIYFIFTLMWASTPFYAFA